MWIELFSDNQIFVFNFNKGGGKSDIIRKVLKLIFHLQRKLNFSLEVRYIQTNENPADEGTRISEVEDLALANGIWEFLETSFGPHSVDHMASHRNVKVRSQRFFSRFLVKGSEGVNVFCQNLKYDRSGRRENAYCFPPQPMTGSYIEYALEQKATVTVVVIKERAESWWPSCLKHTSKIVRLAHRGDVFACVSASGKQYPLKGDMFAVRFETM
eukprot:Lithocolla_globosa_v1_NODE_4615_length_1399_cov_592.279762.p1 type:complete len:214 gc:universal NODE_4615_length_1399_cov_592.279762:715-1356(+)